MTMKKTALDFWVGLFVVLGFVALLFLALKAGKMSSLSFQANYPVKLKFDNIGGLKAREPVKSAGVTVGRVESIGFDSNAYQAVVTIDLDKQYQFPKDTSAKILTSGLLGEQYIGLEPGGDTEMLKAGDTISMTQSAIVLENLIGQFLYSKAADSGAAKPAAPAAALLAGCATVQTPTKVDPLEGFNRTIFTVNDKIDQYALKPAAKGYVWLTHQPVRDSVTNFFSNIGDVYIAANNLLQLKIADGVGDIMRIVINTVFGVGGLFDVATLAKLPKHDNDLGLTLGHYGVPAGPYLVLPLFGPSTVRDAVGSIGNYYVNPITYIHPDGLSWALYGINIVNTRANLLNASDVLSGAALDKYSFVRNAYLQRRQYLLANGKQSQALPNYGDEAPLPKYDD